MVILYELNSQYKMLLEEIKNAFVYKINQQLFKKHMIKCIRHHQLIIK